jgi:hypothetical protein
MPAYLPVFSIEVKPGQPCQVGSKEQCCQENAYMAEKQSRLEKQHNEAVSSVSGYTADY